MLAIVILGFLEVLGIASVLPFMELLSRPDAIEKSTLLQRIYLFFGFEDHRSFLIAVGIFNIAVIALANLFAIFTTYLQFKYSWDISHEFSTRLLKTYLQKPYKYFLGLNTATLRSYLLTEVSTLTSGILVPIIEFISRAFICLVIFALLFFLDPTIALTMIVILGGAYFVIYLSRQKLLKRLGGERMQANIDRYQYLEEMLSGIKTVKVFGADHYFYQRFEKASRLFCNIHPKVKMVYATPKSILEIIAFGGILAIALYVYITTGDLSRALPRLTLYAMAGYRLLPSLQQAFAAASQIKHNLPVIDKLYDDLVTSLNQGPLAKRSEIIGIPFEHQIRIEEVAYQYENSDYPALTEVSLNIKKGSVIAFVGSTGSGKTTLTDLITGLLFPTGGRICVDDLPINAKNAATWQHLIAYVPQDVFMFDDSVVNNITIGADKSEVDLKHLEQVMKMVQISDFVKNELPNGIETTVGERGVRLSGGQRQRLGLARALYRNPKVLILDEATSALDSITEQGIIESLKELPKELTIIIVAHRLSTVKYADHIYLIQDGKIADHGSYDNLVKQSDTFRKMVHLS
jgi:ATP-binding cassette subfamily C protein